MYLNECDPRHIGYLDDAPKTSDRPNHEATFLQQIATRDKLPSLGVMPPPQLEADRDCNVPIRGTYVMFRNVQPAANLGSAG
eukprot:2435382-Prymnesium_polylepis.1